jgi:capsular polysaccharide biosynthesis protein
VNVREYWTVLREDKWLVGSVLVVCVAIAAAVALLLPRAYTSTAIFYVASPQTTLSSSDSYQGAQLSTERVKSYSELLTGPRVAADASALLGGRPSAQDIQKSVSADSVAETVVLNLGVTEPTPQDAQLVGSAVATSFTRLVNSIESTGQPVNRPIVSTELIYPPTLPTYPSGPGTTMLLAAGLLAGVVLGMGAALGRRALRRAVDTSETLETALEAPVLAAVPGLPRRPHRPALLLEPAPGRRGRRAARARDRAAAVRRLRTAVLAASDGRRCLVVAGVRAEQGTTTVALDLAVALAMAGESVLLVDADLRRPALARRLELAADRGLSSVLDGGPLDGAVQRWAPGALDVLPAGHGVEHPGETWGTTRAATALRSLRDAYTWVLLDASPVATSPESVDLARLADGVVLVARRGSARPEDLDAAAVGLRTVGAPLIGSVFTFAVGVPAAPAEAPRALPPGRSASTPAESPAAEEDAPAADTAAAGATDATDSRSTDTSPTAEPATIPEPAATTEPSATAPEPATEPAAAAEPAAATKSESGVVAPVAAAATATAVTSAARARRSRTVRRNASDLTRSAAQEKISDAETAPGTEKKAAATPPVEAPAATATTDAPKRRSSTRKRAATTTDTPESSGPAVEPAATGSDTAPRTTRTRKARTTPAASEATTPAPAEKPARKPRTARRTATTTPGEPAPTVEADAAPSTADATTNGVGSHPPTTNGAASNGAIPASTSNGSTPYASAPDGAAANGASANGTTSNGTTSNGTAAPRARRATRATSSTSSPTDATTTVEHEEPTDTDKPARARTTRTRTPRAGTTGRGPDAAETATRPARTRASRTNPTSTPTSGS